jgi:hypothetical protein
LEGSFSFFSAEGLFGILASIIFAFAAIVQSRQQNPHNDSVTTASVSISLYPFSLMARSQKVAGMSNMITKSQKFHSTFVRPADYAVENTVFNTIRTTPKFIFPANHTAING